MKNLFLLAFVLSVFSASSCKKDYTCVCTAEASGATATNESKINDTKKKAKKECESRSATNSAYGISYTTTCEIK